MQIHSLGPDDAERFLEFRSQLLTHQEDSFRVSAIDDAATPIDAWRSRLKRGHVISALGMNDQWLGVGGLSRFEGEKLCHKGLIWGMYVEPSGRGLGVADEIMRHLIRYAEGRMHHLLLTVIAKNLRARQFYERHGFEVYAVEPESIRLREGYADEALMRRLL